MMVLCRVLVGEKLGLLLIREVRLEGKDRSFAEGLGLGEFGRVRRDTFVMHFLSVALDGRMVHMPYG